MNKIRMLSFFPSEMDVEAISVNPVLTLYVQMNSFFWFDTINLGWSIIHRGVTDDYFKI